MLSKAETIARALDAGATLEEINRQAENQARQVGSVPFNNMIRALNLITYLNTPDDWARLAGAMTAKANARKRS